MIILTLVRSLVSGRSTGTRILDPFFFHLVPPAIMVWIFVWKYIFEPFIHILHFVLQLSRSTNFCFYVQLPLNLVKRQLDLETKVSRTSTSTRYRTLSLQTVTFRKKLLRCSGGKELKNELWREYIIQSTAGKRLKRNKESKDPKLISVLLIRPIQVP